MSRFVQYFVPGINKHLNITAEIVDKSYTPPQLLHSPFRCPLARPYKKGPCLVNSDFESKIEDITKHFSTIYHEGLDLCKFYEKNIEIPRDFGGWVS